MRRIVCHWTAGGPRASAEDRLHYHFLIEQDGSVVRGSHSIRSNVVPLPGRYAAHIRGLNGGSIGIAVCGMRGAVESPFSPGACPIVESQWQRMAEVAAELCRVYRLAVTVRTVLAHGEVESVYGAMQRGKWDPTVLPWNPSLPKSQVCEAFRERVREALRR